MTHLKISKRHVKNAGRPKCLLRHISNSCYASHPILSYKSVESFRSFIPLDSLYRHTFNKATLITTLDPNGRASGILLRRSNLATSPVLIQVIGPPRGMERKPPPRFLRSGSTAPLTTRVSKTRIINLRSVCVQKKAQNQFKLRDLDKIHFLRNQKTAWLQYLDKLAA